MNTETMTIQDKAQAIQKQFTTSTRDDGTRYVHLKGLAGQDYPQWMQDVMFAGHLDRLPNDYSYKAIEEIIDMIVDSDLEDIEEIRDYLYENLEADCYTSNLTSWLNDSNYHVYYLTQALEEYNMTDGFQALTMANQLWLNETAEAVLNALED